MLQFEHNHSIKGLSDTKDATKNGVHYYISDKTNYQISRGTTPPNASINSVC